MTRLFPLILILLLLVAGGVTEAAQCPSTGFVPADVRDAACSIAMELHGDRANGILIVQATAAVAVMTGTESPDVKRALTGLLEMWRKSLGRHSATILIYFYDDKIATVRNRTSGTPYVEFH